MKESKDFRSGTRLLLWEKDKLSMEYEDLQMKWTEIQQTKVIFHTLQKTRVLEEFLQNISVCLLS